MPTTRSENLCALADLALRGGGGHACAWKASRRSTTLQMVLCVWCRTMGLCFLPTPVPKVHAHSLILPCMEEVVGMPAPGKHRGGAQHPIDGHSGYENTHFSSHLAEERRSGGALLRDAPSHRGIKNHTFCITPRRRQQANAEWVISKTSVRVSKNTRRRHHILF